MFCPVCQSVKLVSHTLEKGLTAQRCANCAGEWITAESYWHWLEQHGNPSPEVASNQSLPLETEAQARLCPEDGRILRRYQIFSEAQFYLERCSSCLGVWFDKDEWQALKERQLHDEIQLLFGSLWQDALQAKEAKARLQAMYEARFGVEDYGRVQEMRQWLEQHPNGDALLAYLTDRDPYRY